MSGTVCIRAMVSGLVQGVGFRAWTRHKARLRGLDGWVRNRDDGSVEAVFCGPAEAVESMLTDLRRGPRSGRVDDVATEPADAVPKGSGFEQRPTA